MKWLFKFCSKKQKKQVGTNTVDQNVSSDKDKDVLKTEAEERNKRKEKERKTQLIKYLLFTIVSYIVGLWGYAYYYLAEKRIFIEDIGINPSFFFENYIEPFLNLKIFLRFSCILFGAIIFFCMYSKRNLMKFEKDPETLLSKRFISALRRSGRDAEEKHDLTNHKAFGLGEGFLNYVVPYLELLSYFAMDSLFYLVGIPYIWCILIIYLMAALCLIFQAERGRLGLKLQRYKVVLPVLLFLIIPIFYGFTSGVQTNPVLLAEFGTWLYAVYLIILIFLLSMKILETWEQEAGVSLDHVFYLLCIGVIGSPLVLAAIKIHTETIWASEICMDWLFLTGLGAFVVMVKHWAEINKEMEYYDFVKASSNKNLLYEYNITILDQLCRLGISMLIACVILIVTFLNSQVYFFTMFVFGGCMYSFLNMLYRAFFSHGETDFGKTPRDYVIYKYMVPLLIMITVFLDKSVGGVRIKVFNTVASNTLITSIEGLMAAFLVISVLIFPYMLNYYLNKKAMAVKSMEEISDTKATNNPEAMNDQEAINNPEAFQNTKTVQNPETIEDSNLPASVLSKPANSSLVGAIQVFLMVWGDVLGIDRKVTDTEGILNIYDRLDFIQKTIWRRIIVSEMATGIMLAVLNVYLTITKVPVELTLLIEVFSVAFMIYDAYKLKLNILLKLVTVKSVKKQEEVKPEVSEQVEEKV